MKSPIKNLVPTILNNLKYGVGVILKSPTQHGHTTVFVNSETEKFQITFKDCTTYKCITTQALYKRLSQEIEKYNLTFQEIER